MIEMGLFVALGLMVLMLKMPWKWRLRLLGNPVAVDVAVFTLLTLIHWGTFSGVMVATIGAFMCSVMLSAGRKLVGHIEHGKYHRGHFNVEHRL